MNERLARVTLTRIAEPADEIMGRLVTRYGPEAAIGHARAGRLPAGFATDEIDRAKRANRTLNLDRMVAGWAARLACARPDADLAACERDGGRLVCPGDAEWPTQLDDLREIRPYALWARGDADLRFACLRSIAIVGSRTATPYGVHVAGDLAATLSERGWTVVSGGAYGIDGAAHRGSLTGDAPSVVVLACGTDVIYPRGHAQLFESIMDGGVLLSEWPPGSNPTQLKFLARNRVIAALTQGTVVVEAAKRSGALNTAGHAMRLNRQLGAVPGPVTSAVSVGCHRLIRERSAICVTSSDEVLELVGRIGADLPPEDRGPVLPRDALDEETRRVLEAVPARRGAGVAVIAVAAGVDLNTALTRLGALAAGGFVERIERGWRLRRAKREAA